MAEGPSKAKDFTYGTAAPFVAFRVRVSVAREVQTDSEFGVLDLVPNWSHLPSLSLCFSICEVNGEILSLLPTSQDYEIKKKLCVKALSEV